MNKPLLSAIGLAVAIAFSGPAFAATAAAKKPAKPVMHTYYVGQVVKTKKCEVTTHKPNGKTVAMIGKVSFKTKAAAEAALKADAGCKA